MTTVLAFGCFDLLHVGHVHFLQRARSLGDRLVVGCPSDDVVLHDKGQPPVIPFADRITMLESLEIVDAVCPYFRLEFLLPLSSIMPDVLAVGGDWGTSLRHRDAEAWASSNGCRVVRIARYEGESTSAIKQRIRERPSRLTSPLGPASKRTSSPRHPES